MTTYLQYYNDYLSPKLKEIDIFLKTNEEDIIDINIVSELIELSIEEIKIIMDDNKIDIINKHSFILIMFYGSSNICKLFSREIKCKAPDFYSPYDISYIYQIPYDHVIQAIDKANIKNITTNNINQLFSYIYIYNC